MPFKIITLISFLSLTFIYGHSENQVELNQFLEKIPFQSTGEGNIFEIENTLDECIALEFESEKFFKLNRNGTKKITPPHHSIIRYQGKTYDQTFHIANDSDENIDICLRIIYTKEIAPISKVFLKMLKHIAYKGVQPFFYHLTLREDERSNSPLKISLKTSYAPLLRSLVHFYDQNLLREQSLRLPSYVEHFQQKIIPQIEPSLEMYHDIYSQSYKRTLMQLQSVQEDCALKIPLNIHTVWITTLNAPRMPSNKSFDLLIETINTCKPEHGWAYHFWVERKSDLPSLLESPTNKMATDYDQYINIHEISEVFEHEDLKNFKVFYEDACVQRNYGKASDIARLAILYMHGGIYRDTDFSFIQTPKTFHQVCSFYSGLENADGLAPCNAMIGSSTKHPILLHYLNIIRDNFENGSLSIINNLPETLNNPVQKTLFETGPFAFARALYDVLKNRGIDDVMVAPSPVFFFPTSYDGAERLVFPPIALSKHIHETAWVNAVSSI